MRSGQRGGQREEQPATSVKEEVICLFSTIGPVESFYFTCSDKIFVVMCRVIGEKTFL